MSKVYVTNYSKEYIAAKQFGQLVPITTGFVELKSIDRVRTEIIERISESDSEDYVLISGIATVAAIVCVVWFAKHGQLKLLVWVGSSPKDESAGHYKVVKITKEGMEDMIQILTPATEE